MNELTKFQYIYILSYRKENTPAEKEKSLKKEKDDSRTTKVDNENRDRDRSERDKRKERKEEKMKEEQRQYKVFFCLIIYIEVHYSHMLYRAVISKTIMLIIKLQKQYEVFEYSL